MGQGLLIGYYGYRNLGDELLIFGVIAYIFAHYDVTHLTIAAGDQQFLLDWLHKAKNIIGEETIKRITVKNIPYAQTHKYTGYFTIVGGGEVFSQRRKFYGGRNILVRYFPAIIRKNFALLGGIETPKVWRQKLLYSLVLPRAQSIVLRDATSYRTAQYYNTNSQLYEDFAKHLITTTAQRVKAHYTTSQPYILINLHPYNTTQKEIQTAIAFAERYPDHDCYYVWCGQEDKPLLHSLTSHLPHIKCYDRDQHSVEEIIGFFANASAGVGARLHFLMLLKECNVPLEALVYAEKVKKLILSD